MKTEVQSNGKTNTFDNPSRIMTRGDARSIVEFLWDMGNQARLAATIVGRAIPFISEEASTKERNRIERTPFPVHLSNSYHGLVNLWYSADELAKALERGPKCPCGCGMASTGEGVYHSGHYSSIV